MCECVCEMYSHVHLGEVGLLVHGVCGNMNLRNHYYSALWVLHNSVTPEGGMLHPADDGQQTRNSCTGLRNFSLETSHTHFVIMYMYVYVHMEV